MAIVFSQPFDPSGLTHVANTVDQNAPGFPPSGPPPIPRIMADDFSLAAPTAISTIRFWGGWLSDLASGPPPDLPHLHLTIYSDIGPGVGPEIFSADLGPVPGPPYFEVPAAALAPPTGYFLDAGAPPGPANPITPALSLVNMYDCPVSVPVLPAGTYWLGISVDLIGFASLRFGWSSAVPGTVFGSTCAFSATPFGVPAAPPSWVPVAFPTGGPVPTHPLATTPMHLAFEIEGSPASTTTTAPAGTTTTTAPGGTTAPPATTTAPAAATTTSPCACVELDNGGTITMPAAGCQYQAEVGLWRIIDGVVGGRIDIDAALHSLSGISELPGGALGGNSSGFSGTLQLPMSGTDALAGFTRNIAMPVACTVHTAPRTPGDPVQDFDTDFFSLVGTVVGDPDFSSLTITAGSANGLPSPGRTTLERLGSPGSDWTVDSFFDIEYRIDFVGAPGSVIEGMGGSTTGTIRMQTGPDCIPDGAGTEFHPAEGAGANFRVSGAEVLSYAAAFLASDENRFPGVPPGGRSAYVLRVAAIFLANFQGRYEDQGSPEPYGTSLHAQRWQELPDL